MYFPNDAQLLTLVQPGTFIWLPFLGGRCFRNGLSHFRLLKAASDCVIQMEIHQSTLNLLTIIANCLVTIASDI